MISIYSSISLTPHRARASNAKSAPISKRKHVELGALRCATGRINDVANKPFHRAAVWPWLPSFLWLSSCLAACVQRCTYISLYAVTKFQRLCLQNHVFCTIPQRCWLLAANAVVACVCTYVVRLQGAPCPPLSCHRLHLLGPKDGNKVSDRGRPMAEKARSIAFS